MNSAAGQQILVTAAGSGIGEAIVRRVVSAGAGAAAVKTSREALGGIDQLHDVVGAAEVSPRSSTCWSRTGISRSLVLRSRFLVTKHAAPVLADGGAIVNVSSINARLPHYPASAYSSAKAAVEMFTKSSALEHGPRLRVNAGCEITGYPDSRNYLAQTDEGGRAHV